MEFRPVTTTIIVVLILTIVLVVLKAAFAGERKLPYFSRRFLLTRGESVFYQALRQAIPGHLMICPKVRMSDLVNCSGEAWKAGYGAKITQKHIDFVLADVATTAIAMAIELDDRSHQRADRIERDAFVERVFQAAEIPLLRISAAAKYDASELREQIAYYMSDTEKAGMPE